MCVTKQKEMCTSLVYKTAVGLPRHDKEFEVAEMKMLVLPRREKDGLDQE